MVKTVGGEFILRLRLPFALGFNRVQKPTRNYLAINILNEKNPTMIIITVYQILGLETLVHRFSR